MEVGLLGEWNEYNDGANRSGRTRSSFDCWRVQRHQYGRRGGGIGGVHDRLLVVAFVAAAAANMLWMDPCGTGLLLSMPALNSILHRLGHRCSQQ
jgi:hypothetical protein